MTASDARVVSVPNFQENRNSNARKIWVTNCASFWLYSGLRSSGKVGPLAEHVSGPREITFVTTSVTVRKTPAITPSMLALCSAACKALRFASTALARGLRALTLPPRSSLIGNYVMANRTRPKNRMIKH